VFWTVHQPLRVSIGVAFFFGLCMDVHHTSWLGQHGLAYTVLSFLAMTLHRRLLWFSVPIQALQILPLFMLAHAIELGLRLLGGGIFPGWQILLAPLIEAVLWPLVSIILLLPQQRAPDPDKNRPL
jgi:rod shape-determining protein MreD